MPDVVARPKLQLPSPTVRKPLPTSFNLKSNQVTVSKPITPVAKLVPPVVPSKNTQPKLSTVPLNIPKPQLKLPNVNLHTFTSKGVSANIPVTPHKQLPVTASTNTVRLPVVKTPEANSIKFPVISSSPAPLNIVAPKFGGVKSRTESPVDFAGSPWISAIPNNTNFLRISEL